MLAKILPALFVAGLIAGCAPDARGVRLDSVDLSDQQALANIRAQLSAQDGAALATYVVLHRLGSTSFCGRPLISSEGTEPRTIGEAIELTLARDAEERGARAMASKPKHPRELAQQRWDDLTSQRDALIDAQSSLKAKYGASAEGLPEWRSLETRLADVDRRLIEIKPLVFGAKSGDGLRSPSGT